MKVLSVTIADPDYPEMDVSSQNYIAEKYDLLLQTDTNVVFRGFEKVYPGKQYIIVCSPDKIHLFSYGGKFIKTLASPGRGPGEVSRILDVKMDENENYLYCIQNNKMSIGVYDLKEKKYLREIPLAGGQLLHSLSVVSDTSFICFPLLSGSAGKQCIAYLQNASGKMLREISREVRINEFPMYTENTVLHKVEGGFLYMPYPLDTVFFMDSGLKMLRPVLSVNKPDEKNVFIVFHILFPHKDHFVFSATKNILKDTGEGYMVIYPEKRNLYYIDLKNRSVKAVVEDTDSLGRYTFYKDGYAVKRIGNTPDGDSSAGGLFLQICKLK